MWDERGPYPWGAGPPTALGGVDDVSETDEPECIYDWLEDRITWITDNLEAFDSLDNPGPVIPFMEDHP